MKNIFNRFTWTEKDIEACTVTYPNLDKIKCHSCIHRRQLFECLEYGDEDGLIPDDIAYHAAVCPHYQQKK